MTPYFSTAARCLALRAEAVEWLETPFRENSAARGLRGGADCLRLAEELAIALGVITERGAFPATPMDYSLHVKESKITEWLDGLADDPHSQMIATIYKRIEQGAPAAAGDLVCFRVGHCVAHLGTALDAHWMSHTMRPIGADIVRFDDATFKDRLEVVYRPFEISNRKSEVSKEVPPVLSMEARLPQPRRFCL